MLYCPLCDSALNPRSGGRYECTGCDVMYSTIGRDPAPQVQRIAHARKKYEKPKQFSTSELRIAMRGRVS